MAKLESSSEQTFREHVEYCGCLCLKLNPLGVVGIPDRLIIGSNKFILFVEMKRKTRSRTAKKQSWFHRILEAYGFAVVVAEGEEAAIQAFNKRYKGHLNG